MRIIATTTSRSESAAVRSYFDDSNIWVRYMLCNMGMLANRGLSTQYLWYMREFWFKDILAHTHTHSLASAFSLSDCGREGMTLTATVETRYLSQGMVRVVVWMH